jgi:hypothetical protein
VIKKIINIFSRPVVLNYTLPLVMIYLVIGTVAQKYIGLFEATKIFFSSYILWIGFLPLPGLPVLLGLIFINLVFKLVFKSPWTTKNLGVILTHIGVMLLLLGGVFTALFSEEGYVDLAQGDKKSYVSDYHIRQFVVLDNQDREIFAINHSDLKQHNVIPLANLNLELKIKEHCQNCKIEKRSESDDTHKGMAQFMRLDRGKLDREDEKNMAGVTFSIKGSDNKGTYLTLENVPKLPEITIDGREYRFALRRQQRQLPFTVELLNFKKEMYPGTDLAKSYSSRVRIIDRDMAWESLISMNEPLRYKGYTLYQSSFIQTPQGDMTVLAVVKNAGRVFPYISGLALSLGILIHLFVRRQKGKKRAHA